MASQHQVVKESVRGVLSYPDALPKERGTLATKFNISAAVLFFLGATSLEYRNTEESTLLESLKFCGEVFCQWICLSGVFSLLARIGPFLEDFWYHLASRHDGSLSKLLKRAFKFPTKAYLLLLVALLVSWQSFGATAPHLAGVWPPLLLLASASLIARSVHMLGSPLGVSLSLSGMGGLDYGSGMAESFYHGYLEMVLPAKGDGNKGVVERIDDYIASEALSDNKFPVKKLFILIPSSTYISCRLEELSGWMEAATPLEEQKFSVAGVVNRRYMNQVYKIRDPDDPDKSNVVYVVAEGATPLKTLNDVSKSHPSYRENFSELTHQFFKTLRRKLRTDERTRDTCELIYYVDKDEFGDKVNVGKLILERIREVQACQRLKAQ